MLGSGRATDSSGDVSMVVGEDGDLPRATVEGRQAMPELEQSSCSRLACCDCSRQKAYLVGGVVVEGHMVDFIMAMIE